MNLTCKLAGQLTEFNGGDVRAGY